MALHRYTTRHNKVRSVLVAWLRSAVTSDQQVYADVPDAPVLPVCDLFVHCWLDIAILNRDYIHALELTVCHETNFRSSREYKKIFENLAQRGSAFSADRHTLAHFIEVFTLGFISNVSKFMTAIKIQPLPILVKHKIIKTVLDGLLTVYCNSSSGAISID